MSSSSRSNITILGISFAFIFFGYAGVQQYVSSYFTSRGEYHFGLWSLILVYAFLAFSAPFAAGVVQRYGSKKIMLFASLFYAGYCASLLINSPTIVLISSAFLGIGAAHLWIAEQSYLLRLSEEKKYGKNAGHFSSLNFLGPLLGVLGLGFLIEATSFEFSFAVYAFFPVIGFSGLCFLKKTAEKYLFEAERQELSPKTKPPSENNFFLKKKKLNNITFRLMLYWFTIASIFGIMLSVIPFQAGKYFTQSYLGILLSLFYLIPIISSYHLGKLSDYLGREKMIFISYSIIMSSIILLLFSSFSVFFLIAGVVMLSLSRAINAPTNTALLGDISSDHNVEHLSALSLFSQQMGVVLGLFAGIISSAPLTYTILLAFTIFSFAIISPLLTEKLSSLKGKIL